MAEQAEDSPLARGSLAGSDEVLVLPEAPRGGGSNSRALKVAGLTALACLLVSSQVFTAYMVMNQKQDIHTLQKTSERLGKQLTRASHAPAPMRMAMNSLPMLMDMTLDPDSDTTNKKPTPLTKLQDTVISLESQVKELLQNVEMPKFNETFLANLRSQQHHMNETEWKSFESWMHYWLIFQMAQQSPPRPTPQAASVIKTKCQMEATSGTSKIGSYKPQCDEQGHYKPMQCWPPTGFCWCVDESGTAIPGTSIRGHPDCRRGLPSRRMFAPMPMQKALQVDDW